MKTKSLMTEEEGWRVNKKSAAELIEDFIAELSSEKVEKSLVNNIYHAGNEENIKRVLNLKKYLLHFIDNKPNLILIGEAPGYNGCSLSGIPFTSTKSITDVKFLKMLSLDTFSSQQSEPTSSIVWGYFNSKTKLPLFWNAYPFHPHKKGENKSNRIPNTQELIVGKKYLFKLMSIFPDCQVVAVGKTAHKSLTSIGIASTEIRHPAYGGKSDFLSGLDNICG